MRNVDTVISARWIVPVVPDGVVLTEHSIVVDRGEIVAVLPASDVAGRFVTEEFVELGEHVLIPGLVNAHTHAAMTLLRGFADDLPLVTWLNDHIWPTEGQWVDEAFVGDGTRLAVAEMLSGGVTCFNDMYFFPEVAAEVARDLGMRMVVGLICIDGANNYSSGAADGITKGLALHDRLPAGGLVTAAFAPHAPYSVSDEPLRTIAVLSEKLSIPVHIHLNETVAESPESVGRYGLTPMRRLAALGLVNERLVAAHMVHLSDDDVELAAQASAHVVHCPESNLKLGNGFCDVDRLLRNGINVGLGTDGPASNNDLDVLAELRVAALIAKGLSRDAAVLPARQALRLATLGGARALGLGERIGSVEVGKRADLTAIRLDALANHPIYDPISQVVYTATRQQVSDVWVDGARRVRGGELVGFDQRELHRSAQSWADKITTNR
ncbi:MAG: TRZ/ATZ family hydrolase [Actinobacteria bacterium]|nr:TRZ/ATZ family hydrolase [Actinomycetota bacterium]